MMRTWNESKLFWISSIFLGLYAAVLWGVSPEFWLSPNVLIQDDGRHFVVWLRQMAAPELFPNDPIAAYWHSLTPRIYKLLYMPSVSLGLDVVTWHYLFVVPLACLLLVVSVHGFTTYLLPDKTQAGFATLLLCYLFADTVTNGLPRSFGYSIVLFALTAFLQGRRWLLMFSCMLGAAIYPVAAIVSCVTMGIFVLLETMNDRAFSWTGILNMAVAGIAASLGLLFFLSGVVESGPAISLAEARNMPIFGPGGRTAFFRETMLDQILCKGRGGMLPVCVTNDGEIFPLFSLLATIAVFVLGFYAYRRVSRELPESRRRDINRLLLALMVAGTVLFVAAYLVAFKAHLPAKYTGLSLKLIYHLSVISMVIAVFVQLGGYLNGKIPQKAKRFILICLFGMTWLSLVAQTGSVGGIRDSEPTISGYLRSAPVDARVAGVVDYADSIPAFASRSVYVSMELFVPYKREYYQQMAQRISVLHDIYHSAFGPEFSDLVIQSGIDYFVIAKNSPMRSPRWQNSFPILVDISVEDVFIRTPSATKACTVVQGHKYDLVDAACMAKLAGGS